MLGTGVMRRMLGLGLQRAERRLPALTRLKSPEPVPITLHRRRIYILPTRFGLLFALLLMVMLMGALNYANNAALLLTCLLGAAAVNSMLLSFRTLNRLRLLGINGDPVRAGRTLRAQLHFDIAGYPRHALHLDGYGSAVDISLREPDCDAIVELPTRRRGWMPLPRVRISSTYPFGLFRTWSWLRPQGSLLVYPRAESHGPPPCEPDDAQASRRHEHGDELSALREYRVGDPLKWVAWKASARVDSLRVKTFEQESGQPQWHLRWDALVSLDHEARIRRLTRWIDEAHQQRASWTLQLPQQRFGPDTGDAHFHRCLRALAEMP